MNLWNLFYFTLINSFDPAWIKKMKYFSIFLEIFERSGFNCKFCFQIVYVNDFIQLKWKLWSTSKISLTLLLISWTIKIFDNILRVNYDSIKLFWRFYEWARNKTCNPIFFLVNSFFFYFTFTSKMCIFQQRPLINIKVLIRFILRLNK